VTLQSDSSTCQPLIDLFHLLQSRERSHNLVNYAYTISLSKYSEIIEITV